MEWQKFFAGFDLGGWRREDGKIESDGAVMDGWPSEISVFGNTYTLEETQIGELAGPRSDAPSAAARWENAVYC